MTEITYRTLPVRKRNNTTRDTGVISELTPLQSPLQLSSRLSSAGRLSPSQRQQPYSYPYSFASEKPFLAQNNGRTSQQSPQFLAKTLNIEEELRARIDFSNPASALNQESVLGRNGGYRVIMTAELSLLANPRGISPQNQSLVPMPTLYENFKPRYVREYRGKTARKPFSSEIYKALVIDLRSLTYTPNLYPRVVTEDQRIVLTGNLYQGSAYANKKVAQINEKMLIHRSEYKIASPSNAPYVRYIRDLTEVQLPEQSLFIKALAIGTPERNIVIADFYGDILPVSYTHLMPLLRTSYSDVVIQNFNEQYPRYVNRHALSAVTKVATVIVTSAVTASQINKNNNSGLGDIAGFFINLLGGALINKTLKPDLRSWTLAYDTLQVYRVFFLPGTYQLAFEKKQGGSGERTFSALSHYEVVVKPGETTFVHAYSY